MARSKYVDIICIFAIITAFLLSGLSGNRTFGEKKHKTIGYEDLIFDTSKVHSIDIEMENWDDFIKNASGKKYKNCNVIIDGERFNNIAIRAKGGSSLEDVAAQKGSRYSLKLEFDHNDKSVSYHGLDKLSLNNMIYDTTYMKDYITYRMMQDMGVVTPLVSYSYITVNGNDFGLYLNIEGIEDSFLKRNYSSSSGNLYKPESGGGEFENGEDEYIDWENIDWDSLSDEEIEEMFGGFEEASDAVCLKYIDDNISSYEDCIFVNAKTKITESDKKRLINAIKIMNSGKSINSAVDTDSVIKYFVVHNFVSNDDGYTSNSVHNYYLYEDKGIMSMIPWDYNLAFGTMLEHSADEVINQSVDSLLTGEDVSTRPMFGWIVTDNRYRELYHQYYGKFVSEQIDSGKISEMINNTAELLKPYIEKDPTKYYTADTFPKGVEALHKYFALRSESVKSELEGNKKTVNIGDFRLEALGAQ
ncbi:MAG: CotH kinase family protein [Oscillospiraceae bacterium]|nr:CotH kinase family protein [Oscillospiraceae bacterium]